VRNGLAQSEGAARSKKPDSASKLNSRVQRAGIRESGNSWEKEKASLCKLTSARSRPEEARPLSLEKSLGSGGGKKGRVGVLPSRLKKIHPAMGNLATKTKKKWKKKKTEKGGGNPKNENPFANDRDRTPQKTPSIETPGAKPTKPSKMGGGGRVKKKNCNHLFEAWSRKQKGLKTLTQTARGNVCDSKEKRKRKDQREEGETRVSRPREGAQRQV